MANPGDRQTPQPDAKRGAEGAPNIPDKRGGFRKGGACSPLAKNPLVAASKGFARVCEWPIPEIARPRSQTRSEAPKAPPTSRTREGGSGRGELAPPLQRTHSWPQARASPECVSGESRRSPDPAARREAMRRRRPEHPGQERGVPEGGSLLPPCNNPLVAASKGFARVCESRIPEITRPRSQTQSDAPKAPPTSRTREGGSGRGGACSPLANNPLVAASKGFARVCESRIPEITRPRSQTRSDAPKAPPTSPTGGFWKGGRSPHLHQEGGFGRGELAPPLHPLVAASKGFARVCEWPIPEIARPRSQA